jgi:YHS domain-containing protein
MVRRTTSRDVTAEGEKSRGVLLLLEQRKDKTVDAHGRDGRSAHTGFNYFFSNSKLRTTFKLQKKSFLAFKNFKRFKVEDKLKRNSFPFC